MNVILAILAASESWPEAGAVAILAGAVVYLARRAVDRLGGPLDAIAETTRHLREDVATQREEQRQANERIATRLDTIQKALADDER